MEALWSAALPLLQRQLGERNFRVWIEPIRCTSGEEGEVRLEVPSRFFLDWINRHYLSLIHESVSEVAGRPCTIRTVVCSSRTPQPAEAESDAGVTRAAARADRRSARVPKIGRLVPHYSFATFVVGPSNEVAYNAAQAVSAEPGRKFNPVFLHGGVGLGKTHLANATAHEMLRRSPRLRIACLSAEVFMNDLIGSMRQNQMNGFRERFRRVDALILDDVQFLAGKERTQEEFFHTFNALHGSGKQIVLTSDKPPAVIAGLEPRLRSRFEGGLIADIHPPTREMRLAILHAKVRTHSVELPPAVAEFIVQRSGPSVRELEGALTRVMAVAASRHVELSLALAEESLRPFPGVRNFVSVERIQEAVSSYFRVPVAELLSHERTRRVALPRQIAMYLSRMIGEASYPSIAEKFGGRDHATVMYAVRTIEEKRAKDPSVDQALAVLDGQLRANP